MKYKNLLVLAVMLMGSFSSFAAVVSVTNNEFKIIDGSNSLKSFVFDDSLFQGSNIITDISLSVTFSKCTFEVSETGCIAGGGQSLPFNNEIGLALIGPNGESVSLIENVGGDERFETGVFSTFITGRGDFSFVNILFSDAGQDLFNDLASVIDVNSNVFAPEGFLSDFIGISGAGSWQLFVEDDSNFDPLAFHSATLNITTAQVSAPAVFGIFAFAALGLLARRK